MMRATPPTLRLPSRLTVTVTALTALHGCHDAVVTDASIDVAPRDVAVDITDAGDVVADALDAADVVEKDQGCPGVVLFCIPDPAMDVPDAQCDTVTCYVNGCPGGCRSVG